jgi:hypothetical protein
MAPFHRVLFGNSLRVSLLAGLAACCATLAVSWTDDSRPSAAPDGGPDSQAPDESCRDVLRRVLEKEGLVGEVIEGRLSLTEAAAHFRDLDEQPPPFGWRQFHELYPGASDDERHCRMVIAMVSAEVHARPGSDLAVVDRLETELQDLVGRGDIRLPRPGTAPPHSPVAAPESAAVRP